MPKIRKKVRVCPGCGKFEIGPTRNLMQKYCSRVCWLKYRAGKYLRTGGDCICVLCSKTFYQRGAYVNQGRKYCSRKCYEKSREIPCIVCPVCGKIFQSKTRDQETCSYECSKTGNRNPNWTGTMSRSRKFLHADKVWRHKVYIRDNYICQHCGKTGGSLQAHHKNAYCKYKAERRIVANGVTVCVKCHIEFHKLYGKGKNTAEQWDEFQKTLKEG